METETIRPSRDVLIDASTRSTASWIDSPSASSIASYGMATRVPPRAPLDASSGRKAAATSMRWALAADSRARLLAGRRLCSWARTAASGLRRCSILIARRKRPSLPGDLIPLRFFDRIRAGPDAGGSGGPEPRRRREDVLRRACGGGAQSRRGTVVNGVACAIACHWRASSGGRAGLNRDLWLLGAGPCSHRSRGATAHTVARHMGMSHHSGRAVRCGRGVPRGRPHTVRAVGGARRRTVPPGGPVDS